MSLWVAVAVLAVGESLAVGLMMLVRRRAPAWPAMRHGRSDLLVQRWIEALDHEARRSSIAGAQQTEALTHWFDVAEARQDGRRGRLAEAGNVVPPLVWLVLILGGIVVIGYTCFFADPAERRLGQAMMMLAVSSMVISSLLVIFFLDRPYRDQSGSIRPSAMRTALRVMAADRGPSRLPTPVPCDPSGRPRRPAS